MPDPSHSPLPPCESRVSYDGEVITLAGRPGVHGLMDGAGHGALFNHPEDIEFDGDGNLYVADTGNNAIRKIALATGKVETLPIVNDRRRAT